LVACSHPTVEAGGAKFPVSSAEADIARKFEQGGADCAYWTEKATEAADGSHKETALIVVWESHNSDGLAAWARARRDDACKREETAKPATNPAPESDDRTSREARARQDQVEEARRVAAMRERLDEEVRSGRCDQKSIAHLRGILDSVTQVMFPSNATSAHSDVWTLLGHRFEVATATATDLSINAGLGGETHVFVIGFAPPKLSLKDGQGYAISTPSMYAEPLASVFQMRTVGLQTRASSVEKLSPSIEGRGCVLVFAVQKL
jgi:hypothetical protein